MRWNAVVATLAQSSQAVAPFDSKQQLLPTTLSPPHQATSSSFHLPSLPTTTTTTTTNYSPHTISLDTHENTSTHHIPTHTTLTTHTQWLKSGIPS